MFFFLNKLKLCQILGFFCQFQGCQLKEVHPGYVHYHITEEEGVSWGEIFRKMEEAKATFRLEAYSVGQTSLEQVFLSFTKGQINND